MNLYAFAALVCLVFLAFAFWLGHDTRSRWFSQLRSRDRKAFQRLVVACGGNKNLARQVVAHERLLDERATEYQAIMRAVGTIENRRLRGIPNALPSRPPIQLSVPHVLSRSLGLHAAQMSKLVTACFGDVSKAERLVQYELSFRPDLSRSEAIAAALSRLQADRT